MNEEKSISYTTTNTYQTCNKYTPKTQNIWLVFHGLGYLSRYFIEHFKDLNPEENYIIAPQAPSLYYQDKRYNYVGACWLTRENREQGIENNHAYLDALYEKELKPKLEAGKRLIVMGFSQGVSVAMRWLDSRKLICDQLILHSGSIPKDFEKNSFQGLIKSQPVLLFGKKDKLISHDLLESETQYAQDIFGTAPKLISFDGGHEVHEESIRSLVL
ncbi:MULTISPECIES: esterase [unclassified Leeuwenhoekiella]|uniref:alpha/beta hydrolase n=1 Tax=unclassified Leeuwenhoekiella TaxID=2615029 RepID=UPI000C4FEBA5|nr:MULTISPECIES: esterase [unclassified Leeuwenhoekiella]MAW95062.1 esterase [Leeuwenhoekiella sp.]MBA79782.1 esterase [Leeuwenhoekiella sp.]|tara:strand:- start:12549 stop:13196 length:648 start_codon:yes stop_codon:yes gene_type:complete